MFSGRLDIRMHSSFRRSRMNLHERFPGGQNWSQTPCRMRPRTFHWHCRSRYGLELMLPLLCVTSGY